MALEIIGAGFGRTGTLSLKLALEQLGLGPCYHMIEIHREPDRARVWIDALDGKPADWDVVFAGYRATVDWPACHWWRDLADYYPNAKVLLSKRDPSAWFKSIHNTIVKATKGVSDEMAEAQPHHPAVLGRRILLDEAFGGRVDDEDYVTGVFEAHNRAVCEAIALERLLVYEPGDGWEPLCRFFGVPVPDTDYPHANSTEDFQPLLASFGNAGDGVAQGGEG